MIGINWAILGAGLTLGAIGGWLAKQTLSSTRSQSLVTAPLTPPEESVSLPSAATLQQQLRQTQLAYEMASEMAKFQAGFLARTAHELRSPINSVISLHQLILADLCDSPDEERAFVSQASVAAEKMLATLDELIRLSKLQHGSSQPQLMPISLATILNEVEQMTHLQAKNRNLRLTIELPDPAIQVEVDPHWLTQVLIHLIDAPLSLMQDGFVEVSTQLDAQHIHIEIRDQRPADFWAEEIDLLHALKTSTTSGSSDLKATLLQSASLPKLPSAGLTLLIDRAVLEWMGGHLELVSLPSSGVEAIDGGDVTCIRCTLPVAAAQ